MTAEEIRAVSYADVEGNKADSWAKKEGWDRGACAFFLREIAAQLAEIKEILGDPRSPADRLRDQARGMR